MPDWRLRHATVRPYSSPSAPCTQPSLSSISPPSNPPCQSQEIFGSIASLHRRHPLHLSTLIPTLWAQSSKSSSRTLIQPRACRLSPLSYYRTFSKALRATVAEVWCFIPFFALVTPSRGAYGDDATRESNSDKNT